MNWIAKEIKHKRTGSVMCNRTNVPGTDAWEFIHPDMPMPLGTLTVRFIGKCTLDILYVFVCEKYRRCGIATRMLEVVVKHNLPELKAIITGGVNQHSKPWVQKLSFEPDDVMGWVKRLKPIKSRVDQWEVKGTTVGKADVSKLIQKLQAEPMGSAKEFEKWEINPSKRTHQLKVKAKVGTKAESSSTHTNKKRGIKQNEP